MKPILLLAPLLLILSSATRAEAPINEILRDALYAEEVTRDTEAAAKQYEEVVARYTTQRRFAATAIFRLAEVRRKQGKKEEATALYQRLAAEFPESETEVALAKENLTALGVAPAAGNAMPAITPAPETDYETAAIARVRQQLETSPDVATGAENLSSATQEGYLKLLAYLLENGADPNLPLSDGASNPLQVAASRGNLAICEMLLKAGARLEADIRYSALATAVDQNHLKIVDLLLKAGADVNFVSPSFPDMGTPLEIAVSRSASPIMIGKLIAAKADVNRRNPLRNITPLHIAVAQRNQEIIRILAEAGADPNIRANAESHITNDVTVKPGDTPLAMAAASGSAGILKMLLPKASPAALPDLLMRASSVEIAKVLLEKKIDVNGTTPERGTPLFIFAVCQDEPEIVKAFLQHGADPRLIFQDNGRVKSALRAAVESNGRNSETIARILLEAGATADEAWLDEFTGNLANKGIQQTGDARNLIIEQFVIPRLTRREAVTLFFTVGATGTVQLASKTEGVPDSLPQLLAGGGDAIQWPRTQTTPPRFPERVAVWRKSGEGDGNKATRIWSGTLRQKEDFPALEWGDVVQIGFEGVDREERSQTFSFQKELPDEVEWNLRKRISFPIKVEVDGKVQDFTMRGDRLIFDPTRPELPLMQAHELPHVFWPAGYNTQDGSNRDSIRALISRNGWPATAIPDLRAGDQVKITLPLRKPQEEASRHHRRQEILVRAVGMPGVRSWEVPLGTKPEDCSTLTQILADLLSFSPLPETEAPGPEKLVEWLFRWKQSGALPMLWNNPDFSDIVIKRLKPDDSEETFKIDLAAAIRKSATLSAAETKKADIQLQAGDIIELKLRPDTETEIWKGLTREEEAFFAKTLGGAIQVLDGGKGNSPDVFIKELSYEALTYVQTEAGKVPARKKDHRGGFSSMTLRAIFGTMEIQPTPPSTIPGRRTVTPLTPLRDGDQVSIRTGAAARTPRPRATAPSGQ